MIRAYRIPSGSRGPDDLRVVELPDPDARAGQVVVRVRAASLNFRDQAIVRGDYPGVKENVIPLSDGAGEVVAIGEGVTQVRVGDRVAGTFFQTSTDPMAPGPVALGAAADGVLAERVVLNEDGVVPIPDAYSYEQAACLPCAALTAWHALFRIGRPVAPGSAVLALGTGGVSTFAVQFARAAGCRVIVTSSSDEKLARMRDLGAELTVNYRTTPEWDREVLRLTEGRGADCVIEVGGVGTMQRSINVLARGGKIALIGVLTGRDGSVNPYPLMFKGGSLHGVYVGDRAMFLDMNQAIGVTGITPVIDRVFPFEEASDAYKYQASGQMLGKVVIQL